MCKSWQQPFTVKRYIHPPFSDKICTMWPDMKIMISTMGEQNWGMTSSAFRILVGDAMESPDFKSVQYFTRPDGVPIHKIAQKAENFEMEMESFCDIKRNPVCYTAITVINNTEKKITDKLYLLPRTGREEYLTGMEIDGYASYNSSVYSWGYIPTDFSLEKDFISDGNYSIKLQLNNAFSVSWQGNENGLDWYKRGCAVINFELEAMEKKTFFIAFTKGCENNAFDYFAERKKTEQYWLSELKKIKKIPGGEKRRDIVNNLVLQCLQMFAYLNENSDAVIPRQGGLQRRVWQTEAMEFLIALDRFGDFHNYTEKVYDTYCNVWQIKEGENQGAITNSNGEPWGSITGASVYSIANHLLCRKDKSVFLKFREPLLSAFAWMQNQRAQTLNGEFPGYGIFSPKRACDWPQVGQSWCFTDCVNLLGYKALYDAFSLFDDPMTPEIYDAYNDYMACMKKILDDVVKNNLKEDELLIPSFVGVAQTDPPSTAYFAEPGYLLRAEVAERNSDTARKLEAWFRHRNLMKNGLTGLMNTGRARHGSDPWAGHTWYLSMCDYSWFLTWLSQGEKEKAEETLKAQLTYCMTKEYYLCERYADNDPYFVPWLPNASANGRLLMMFEQIEE